jgi:hypothetical protein
LIELEKLAAVLLEHAPQMTASCDNWPEMSDEDGSFALVLARWVRGASTIADAELTTAIRGYGRQYVDYHPGNQYSNERAVKEGNNVRSNHQNSSEEMHRAKHQDKTNLLRKAQREIMLSELMTKRKLGHNQYVHGGDSASRRQRTGDGDGDGEVKVTAYSSRYRFSKLSAVLFIRDLERRAAEAEGLLTKSLVKTVKAASKNTNAGLLTGEETRIAQHIAGFRAKWSAARDGRSRALYKDVALPLMQPVVGPRLTGDYPLGAYNSREKVVAELEARGVDYSPGDPFRPKDGETSLTERLKALPDVFTHPVQNKLHLKRKGPSWDGPSETDDGDLLEQMMAGRSPEIS